MSIIPDKNNPDKTGPVLWSIDARGVATVRDGAEQGHHFLQRPRQRHRAVSIVLE